MLEISNLHSTIGETPILKGLNLSIPKGQVHAIMGQNGSGKSTLANIIMGNPQHEIQQGELKFEDKNINDLEPEERAAQGIFLAFQYPIEIAGVPTSTFLRYAINTRRVAKGEKELDAMQMVKHLREVAKSTGVDEAMLKRHLNYGFSGGEKKRLEIFQMCLLDPKLVIMDETDSGLDIDALKQIAGVVGDLRNSERSFLIITHYQRLLDHIVPDVVHVMKNGQIVETGGPEIAHRLESQGYASQAG